eukprot:1156491-Pelagomonas_calceolata.AAC.3
MQRGALPTCFAHKLSAQTSRGRMCLIQWTCFEKHTLFPPIYVGTDVVQGVWGAPRHSPWLQYCSNTQKGKGKNRRGKGSAISPLLAAILQQYPERKRTEQKRKGERHITAFGCNTATTPRKEKDRTEEERR